MIYFNFKLCLFFQLLEEAEYCERSEKDSKKDGSNSEIASAHQSTIVESNAVKNSVSNLTANSGGFCLDSEEETDENDSTYSTSRDVSNDVRNHSLKKKSYLDLDKKSEAILETAESGAAARNNEIFSTCNNSNRPRTLSDETGQSNCKNGDKCDTLSVTEAKSLVAAVKTALQNEKMQRMNLTRVHCFFSNFKITFILKILKYLMELILKLHTNTSSYCCTYVFAGEFITLFCINISQN